VHGADVGNVSFEPRCNVVAGTQRKRQALREAGLGDSLAKQVRQLVEPKLLGDAAGRRRRTIDVVEAVRDRNVLDDVTCMDHVVPSRWNLNSNTTTTTTTSSFWLLAPLLECQAGKAYQPLQQIHDPKDLLKKLGLGRKLRPALHHLAN